LPLDFSLRSLIAIIFAADSPPYAAFAFFAFTMMPLRLFSITPPMLLDISAARYLPQRRRGASYFASMPHYFDAMPPFTLMPPAFAFAIASSPLIRRFR